MTEATATTISFQILQDARLNKSKSQEFRGILVKNQGTRYSITFQGRTDSNLSANAAEGLLVDTLMEVYNLMEL